MHAFAAQAMNARGAAEVESQVSISSFLGPDRWREVSLLPSFLMRPKRTGGVTVFSSFQLVPGRWRPVLLPLGRKRRMLRQVSESFLHRYVLIIALWLDGLQYYTVRTADHRFEF